MEREFELWVTDGPGGTPFDPESDFFNAQVTLSTGERYALNIWALSYFDVARRECSETGRCLGSRYLTAPDLLITRLDRVHIEEVIADMLARDDGRLNEQWRVHVDNDY